MTVTNQQILTSDLHPTVSAERLGTYQLAANRDEARALDLYIWNAHVGEAFHLPIQATEVALRNAINNALIRRFGPDWWNTAAFLNIASARQKKDITDVTRRIQKRGSTLCTGQIVANLSFGFWAGMLDSSYQVALPHRVGPPALLARRIVGWSMKEAMTTQMVTDALMMAIWRRGRPRTLMHHSDQGSQYTSEAFQRLMRDNGITCSMSRSGNCWDNAAMESFFSSLKTERIRGQVYRTRDQARSDVFDYIERFYNPTRRHSTLGYLSPMQYEEQAMEA